MADLQARLPQPNGEGGDRRPLQQPSNPHPSTIGAESWHRAELAVWEVIRHVHPTHASEQRRKAVMAYVTKLIKGFLHTEVLPFGSVPLKTYLPDGDIDLTALAVPNSEDRLAGQLRSVLKDEEQNGKAEFEVKDTQYIQAEVKLVKCRIQNIVVDISFNQIGGLSTLCFLEQVDCLIGKNNLFKRSILLIKAWCYYESRILGAHHGLISTYALETLVLYIFHLFHSSLNGPLAVLYRFLDYYSKFDWDNYCISLYGPISVSSLPELVAEAPENDGGDLLLNKDFLRNCSDMFSDPPRGLENNTRSFLQKHLNIVDPLKKNNNLGRSVSKGNSYRIRSAFTYGARKLGHILVLPAERIADEVNMFFMDTLAMHGSGERPDVRAAVPSCPNSVLINHNGNGTVSSQLKVEKIREDKRIIGKSATGSRVALCEEINNIRISGSDKEHETRMQLRKNSSNKQLDSSLNNCTELASNGPVEWTVVSGRNLVGDSGDIASSKDLSRFASETIKSSSSNSDMSAPPSGKAYHATRSFHQDNGIGNGTPARDLVPRKEIDMLKRQDFCSSETSSNSVPGYNNHEISAPAGSINGSMTSRRSTSWPEYPQLAHCSLAGNEEIDANASSMLNQLLDLSGDYDTHLGSLQYAQWCREYWSSTLHLPFHPSPPSQYLNKYPQDAVRPHPMYTHTNGVVPGPPFPPPGSYPINPPFVPGAYGMENMSMPRGAGPYFPITNYPAYRGRQPLERGRNPTPTYPLPRPCNSGWAGTARGSNFTGKSSRDSPVQAQIPISSVNHRWKHAGSRESFAQAQLPISGVNHHWKPAMSNIHDLMPPASKSLPHANGFSAPFDSKIEFGSLGPVPLGASSLEVGKESDSANVHSQVSGTAIPAIVQRSMISLNPERPEQYQLKNNDDFPPLTG